VSLNQLVAEFSFCTPSAPPLTYAFKQIRWDERAGLRGMRYAPSVSTCSRHNKKETGDEEE
jgi:hypothetical protein